MLFCVFRHYSPLRALAFSEEFFRPSSRHLVGPLERVIGPSQALYLHRKITPKDAGTHKCLGWYSSPRSLCSKNHTHALDRTTTVIGRIIIFHEPALFTLNAGKKSRVSEAEG